MVHAAERWLRAVASSRLDGTCVAAGVLRFANHMAAGLRGLGTGRITAIIVRRNAADHRSVVIVTGWAVDKLRPRALVVSRAPLVNLSADAAGRIEGMAERSPHPRG